MKKIVEVRPSERQLRLQRMEFYAFVHFTVNTFTDREWGDGSESPSVFDPTKFDAKQWVDALRVRVLESRGAPAVQSLKVFG